jgi:hypothetical protein
MSASEAFRGIAAWGRRIGGEPSGEGHGPAPSGRELRQRHLQRVCLQGIPRWSEDPEHCDGCGRELLIGERGLLLQRDDELAIACPLCADELRAAGYVRADCAERDATEPGLRRAGTARETSAAGRASATEHRDPHRDSTRSATMSMPSA